MGVSLVLSMRSQLRSDRSRCSVWLTSFQRSLILIVLGLLLNSFGHLHNDLSLFRYCGVLQRLGACYLIIASVETIFMNLQGSNQVCSKVSQIKYEVHFRVYLLHVSLSLGRISF